MCRALLSSFKQQASLWKSTNHLVSIQSSTCATPTNSNSGFVNNMSEDEKQANKTISINNHVIRPLSIQVYKQVVSQHMAGDSSLSSFGDNNTLKTQNTNRNSWMYRSLTSVLVMSWNKTIMLLYRTQSHGPGPGWKHCAKTTQWWTNGHGWETTGCVQMFENRCYHFI